MDVVGHDDESVEFVYALGAVVLEGFEKEFGVGGELEEAAAIVGDRGDEEGSFGGGSRRNGHGRNSIGWGSGCKSEFLRWWIAMRVRLVFCSGSLRDPEQKKEGSEANGTRKRVPFRLWRSGILWYVNAYPLRQCEDVVVV